MSKNVMIFAFLVACLVVPLSADTAVEIQTRQIAYTAGGVTLEGYLAWNPALAGTRPGILVVHEWTGLNAYAKRRTVDLAREGYVAFALDMYGEGKEVPSSEARQRSSSVSGNFALIKERFNAALAVLASQPGVDKSKIAAIGYCFGGGIVLNMARMGTELKGVVSFHGSLNTGLTAKAGDIKTRILAFQGDGDPAAPLAARTTFATELDQAKADYRYVVYPGVKAHNFTNPDGATYHAKEADAAWEEMKEFFRTLFGT